MMKMPRLPEPTEASVSGYNVIVKHYSADQLRAYGAAVREACARQCEEEALRLESGYVSEHDDRCIGARECAASIRQEEQ